MCSCVQRLNGLLSLSWVDCAELVARTAGKILDFFFSAQDTQKLQQLAGQLEMIRARAPRVPPGLPGLPLLLGQEAHFWLA